mgnify:CR=1 FL=1
MPPMPPMPHAAHPRVAEACPFHPSLQTGAKKVVNALQLEKEALQLECTGLQREIRRMSEPGMSGHGMAGGTTQQQDQANLDQANLELAAAAEREAALSRHPNPSSRLARLGAFASSSLLALFCSSPQP